MSDTTSGPLDLVPIGRAASILGVTRQRADELSRRTDCPAPAQETPLGRLWNRADIEAYAANRKEQTT